MAPRARRATGRRSGAVRALLLAAAALLSVPLACRQVHRLSEGELTGRQRVDVHKSQGLDALIMRIRRGPLLPSDAHALVTVDQRLVQSLLSTLVPSDHLLDRFRIRLVAASVSFEDGFALVRLEGKASLADVPGDAFADLTVFGDLRVSGARPDASALQAQLGVIAVDVRHLGLLGAAGERLAGDLGRARLEEFAALVSPLEIPVRQGVTIEIPDLATSSVHVETASVPVYFRVLEVTAFHGRLWITMAASTRQDDAGEPAPAAALPAVPPRAWSAALETSHRKQHAVLEALLAGDELVRDASHAGGDVVFAIRSAFAKEVIAEVVARYFDKVVVDLSEIAVAKQGSVDKDTLFGRMRVGDWTADLQVERVHGVLRAGRPEVQFPRDDRIALALPLRLEHGNGRARLHFAWDSHGLANLVCRDFEADEALAGSVRAEDYRVEGSLTLEAAPDILSVDPDFTDRFRIKLDLHPDSWDGVQQRLEKEDHVLRCGLPMDAGRTLAQLRELVERGFEVRLPEKLFRTIRLPAEIADSVQIGGYAVGVGARKQTLRLTPEFVWYAAEASLDLPQELTAGIAVAGKPDGGA